MTEHKILRRGRAAILYDARVAGKISEPMFDADYWLERDRVLGEASGRGTTLYVSADGGEWVLRPYRRGGLFGRFVRRWYVYNGEDRTRCFREFRALDLLCRRGMPVPRPVAAWYRRTGPVYQAALITERLPDTHTIAQSLKRDRLPPETWLAVGRCLRRFHDAGLNHADLNAHNILLDSSGQVFVVDLDRARMQRAGPWCRTNLARLRRSLNKVSVEEGAEFRGDSDWAALMSGYGHDRGRPA